MRIALPLVIGLALAGCAHTDVAINNTAPSGAAAVSGGVGVHVNASGAVAAVLAAGLIIAGTASERDDEGFLASPAPEMDPHRTVNEQDCTRPVLGTGNLKCR